MSFVPRRLTVRRLMLVMACLALLCMPFVGIAVDVFQSKKQRRRLLYETDHQALLAASRILIRDFAGQHIGDPAQDPRVPPIIRELGPSYIGIAARQLRCELHGGFDHYGFIAYLEGANGEDRWGKLIDGLVYYTE